MIQNLRRADQAHSEATDTTRAERNTASMKWRHCIAVLREQRGENESCFPDLADEVFSAAQSSARDAVVTAAQPR